MYRHKTVESMYRKRERKRAYSGVEIREGHGRGVRSPRRLGDYHLCFGVFGNQLHQAAVGGTLLSLGPLVEQPEK